MSIIFDPTILPLEIVEFILSQLRVKDKARLTRLNRAWNHLLNTHARAWNVLDFEEAEVSVKRLELYCSRADYNVKVFRAWHPPRVLQALRRCPKLEILELGRGGQKRFIGLGWADFTTFTSLRTLSLQDHLRPTPAMAIIGKCHQLEHIQLTINDPNSSPVWTTPLGTNVRTLKLLVDHEVEVIYFQKEFLKDAKNLEELSILGPHALPSMIHLGNLSSLTLQTCIILSALPASLLRLDVSACDGPILADALPPMTRLESLRLSSIYLMAQAICWRIMDDIGTKLKHLSLNGVYVNDSNEHENEDAMSSPLLDLLQSCRSMDLRSLKLYINRAVNLDLMFYVIGSKFSKLTQLEVSAQHMLQPTNLNRCVKRVSALEFLALRKFKIEEDVLQAIRKRGVVVTIEDE